VTRLQKRQSKDDDIHGAIDGLMDECDIMGIVSEGVDDFILLFEAQAVVQ
jgi:hypothetical protein